MIKLTAPETFTATIGGVEWSNITPASHMWEQVQAMIAGGAEVEDMTAPQSPEQALAAERAAMTCSPAQMRITLAGAGLLGTVQAIADANPQAAILWEYATQIRRNSPLIDALGGANGFEPEQIDDLFRAAMALDI